jgi:hypothetical protein
MEYEIDAEIWHSFLSQRATRPAYGSIIASGDRARTLHYVENNKEGAQFNRSSVYRMNINSGKDPLLDAFDCPDPAVKTPRRGVTITPLQALELMNNAFVQRQAKLLAERVLKSSGNDLNAAIQLAYQLVLARPPGTEEAELALAAAKERDFTSVCWALLNSTEFLYVR